MVDPRVDRVADPEDDPADDPQDDRPDGRADDPEKGRVLSGPANAIGSRALGAREPIHWSVEGQPTAVTTKLTKWLSLPSALRTSSRTLPSPVIGPQRFWSMII